MIDTSDERTNDFQRLLHNLGLHGIVLCADLHVGAAKILELHRAEAHAIFARLQHQNALLAAQRLLILYSSLHQICTTIIRFSQSQTVSHNW